MRNRSKLLLVGLTAAFILATVVSTASARRLSVSQTDFYFIWKALRFSGGGSDIACSVTLLGTFHSRTFAKVEAALIGHIIHARIDGSTCAEGTATVLTETLPWHLTYAGFIGILPNISIIGFLLVGAAFRVEAGVSCLARTDAVEPARGNANLNTSGQFNNFRMDETYLIDLDDPGFLCELAGDVAFSGTTTKVATLTGHLIFIDLI